jgi:hypothetical protein
MSTFQSHLTTRSVRSIGKESFRIESSTAPWGWLTKAALLGAARLVLFPVALFLSLFFVLVGAIVLFAAIPVILGLIVLAAAATIGGFAWLIEPFTSS